MPFLDDNLKKLIDKKLSSLVNKYEGREYIDRTGYFLAEIFAERYKRLFPGDDRIHRVEKYVKKSFAHGMPTNFYHKSRRFEPLSMLGSAASIVSILFLAAEGVKSIKSPRGVVCLLSMFVLMGLLSYCLWNIINDKRENDLKKKESKNNMKRIIAQMAAYIEMNFF